MKLIEESDIIDFNNIYNSDIKIDDKLIKLDDILYKYEDYLKDMEESEQDLFIELSEKFDILLDDANKKYMDNCYLILNNLEENKIKYEKVLNSALELLSKIDRVEPEDFDEYLVNERISLINILDKTNVNLEKNNEEIKEMEDLIKNCTKDLIDNL